MGPAYIPIVLFCFQWLNESYTIKVTVFRLFIKSGIVPITSQIKSEGMTACTTGVS